MINAPIRDREKPTAGNLPERHRNDPTDDEIREMVVEELEQDGRVPLATLEINCEDGVIYLDGVLPDEYQREWLLEIIVDTLGYEHIEDNTRIDHQHWNSLMWASEDDPDDAILMESEEEDLD